MRPEVEVEVSDTYSFMTARATGTVNDRAQGHSVTAEVTIEYTPATHYCRPELWVRFDCTEVRLKADVSRGEESLTKTTAQNFELRSVEQLDALLAALAGACDQAKRDGFFVEGRKDRPKRGNVAA